MLMKFLSRTTLNFPLYLTLVMIFSFSSQAIETASDDLNRTSTSCSQWLQSNQIQFNDLEHRKAWLISAAKRAERAQDEIQKMKYLKELHEVDPLDPLTHAQLASVYRQQENYAAALYHFRERARLEGPTARNLMNLLLVYRHLPGADEVLWVCELALKKYPKDAKILGATAQVFMALGLYDAALKTLDQKLALNPNDRHAYGLKSQIRQLRRKEIRAR